MSKLPRLPPEDDEATSSEARTSVHTPTPGDRPASSDPDFPTWIDSSSSGPNTPTTLGQAITSNRFSAPEFTLPPGRILAQRYEILQILGEGGMGAVYKAIDRELDRLVALKVIRPELAGNLDILQRFKQEILLASKVTDRNIIRIYDLGDAEGLKFITMEYIEGEDLGTLLRREGKLPVKDAVAIMRQILSGLQCAHREGIVHRDLKPGNIMRDSHGRVVVMDFGLARAVGGGGMTQTGSMIGTLEYMSPEQAQAKDLDSRSDIFTVGLIFYELLTGKMPYKAESAVASLLKRTQERANPISNLDGTVPRALSDLVSKCLEREPKSRYQSSAEVLSDLASIDGGSSARSLRFPSIRPWGQSVRWSWISVGVAVLLLTGAGYFLSDKLTHSPSSQAPIKVDAALAILPFRNASGDASLDWLGQSLADMLSTDVGQSPRVRTVSQDRLRQVLTDLHLAKDTNIDLSTMRRLAEFSNADTLVSGQFARFGDEVRIDATIHDLKHDRRTLVKAEAINERDIPAAIDRLADSIRQNLAVSPDVLQELRASSFLPSSKSVPALREYNEGLELLRHGKNLEAEKGFVAATKEDPQFALAFSKLAETYANLGYDNQAEQSSRRAVEMSENLPPSEKYLIGAADARISKNYPKAIEAYENLARISRDNTDVQSALASVYEDTGNFQKASEHYQTLLAANPNDTPALLSVGRVSIKSGEAQASLDPLNRALSLAVRFDNQEQKALVLQAMGIAYSMLNKPDEALQDYQQSLEIKRRLGQKKGIADSLNMIAEAYDGLGKSSLALKNYQEALKTYREIGDRQDVGNVLVNLGQFYHDRGNYDDALKLFKQSLQIQRDLGNENYQGVCLNNIGNAYLFKGDYDNAHTYFEQALQIREKIKVPSDIADTLHNLGETSVKMGQLDQALAQYLRALDLRRTADDKLGAAKESDSLGILFAYQGRFGAALKAREEAMSGFRELHDHSYWMAETMGGYGRALSQVGRYDEATKALDDSLNLARELKHEDLVAQILDWKGDTSFYKGDLKAARLLNAQALQGASKSSDRHLLITLKLNAIKVSVGGAAASAITTLHALADEADGAGLKYASAEASLYAAEALIKMKDFAGARTELERSMAISEKLGARPLLAKAHLTMGNALRLSGNIPEAAREYRNALQSVEEMRKDAGNKFMDRADCRSIVAEATHWAHI